MSDDNQEIREKLFVRYKSETFDLTQFAHKHPGGKNTLSAAFNSDIDYKFETAMPHSQAAKYLLKEYRVSNQINNNNNNDDVVRDGNKCDSEMSNSKQSSHGETFEHNSNGRNNVEHLIRTDDSMEHLVDWSRGMIAQIGSLGSNYTEWVNKPVDRPLHLFDTNLLEMLTKTPWWLVPTFWIPIIIFLISMGIDDAYTKQYGNGFIVWQLILGVFLWTLIEYSLHRWVFHLDASNHGGLVCTLHFLLHGLHHKVPFDPYRLVFPPFPATILAIIIYIPIQILLHNPKLVFAGGLTGYLCYDMMHYYIHHGSPSGGHLYFMKRYHYQHHFVHHDKGFGISSSIWDEAFDTKIILRKLKYLLK
ncbi:dihydroceramide fatty acyl 2-hydroxylase FAH2 isoform X2 [Contarinia nasturtii]|nr:dihydroceramide fatty acyl 2-hydroxylase FAH2 isoform X2 [Contarinia nasturtii]